MNWWGGGVGMLVSFTSQIVSFWPIYATAFSLVSYFTNPFPMKRIFYRPRAINFMSLVCKLYGPHIEKCL